MFITREYDYALRSLRALAHGEQLTVKQICTAEHVPVPYGYKILKKLELAGIVQGYRGAQGGYKLNMPLDKVTLYNVYIAIEGELYINECMQEGYDCPNNPGGSHCAVHRELGNMQNSLINSMQSRSLADILQV